MNGFGQYAPLATCDPSVDPSGLCPATCSWLTTTYDFFVDAEGWQRCQIAAGQAQIQSVADNAAIFYGANSQTAQTAQQAADQQKAQVASDVSNIADYYHAGTIQPPSLSSLPTWVVVAGAVMAGLMVLNVVRR